MKKPLDILKKVLKIAVGVAVIGGIGYGVYWMLSEDIEVRCVKAAETEYADSFTENAYIKSGDSINCVSETDGAVVSVNVHKNQAVKKGDVIAVISSKDLEFEKQTLNDEIAALRAGLAETKQNDSFDRKDIRNSINELDVQLEQIENARKQKKFEKNMEVSPQTYLDVLKTAVDAAKTDLDFKQNELENKKKLFTAGVIAKNELDEAQNSYDSALNSYDDAVQKYDDAYARTSENSNNDEYYKSIQEDFDIQLKSIYAKRDSLESQLENDKMSSAEVSVNTQIAEKQTLISQIDDKIARCTVKAQADGIVSQLPAEKINHVSAGDVLAVIKPESELRAEADILTNEEPYLNVGDTVKLTQKLKNDKMEYSGTIAEIYSYAEKTTSALGNDEYRVKVVITLDDAQNLKDGYELEAEFVTYSTESGLVVPNSSLYKKGDNYYLFKNDGGKAKEIPVVLAHRGNINSEIASGISAGDEVIIDANTKDLVDGAEIKAKLVE
ncbi:MAG: HlyD family efflux transporter periplasmic adaptor subunit [Firmicutes bacterium]|nr:HlyD family efflux transporter periplasmic adaptor subunit [Bacillota bacterium]